jgi:DNA-binding transcriptional MerR regulator
MSDNMGSAMNTANEGSTQPNATTTSANERVFTQQELDAIVTKRLSQLEKKYQGIDVNEYQKLMDQKSQQETEQAIKRQEFDKVLGQVKSSAEQKITALQQELEKIKIDGSLISEASSRKAVAPDKVATLLRSQLKLTQDGQVEVLDKNGSVMYNADKATPMSVGDLVDSFLRENPYFVQAGPSGSGSRNAGHEINMQNIDIASLDMRKAEHRELYRKMKQTK